MKKLKYYLIILQCGFSAIFASCGKFVEIPESRSQIENSIVFADTTLANAALLSIYYTLGTPTSAISICNRNFSLYTDEYIHTAPSSILLEYNQSRLLADNSQNASLWGNLYAVIYQANALIEETAKSSKLSEGFKRRLTGEAKFLRAYTNFYLVNLYDRIPLILTTDVGKNARASQVDPALVYDQIIKDLLDAQSNLDTGYPGGERIRANAMVASALLARVYLYQQQWKEAEIESGRLITSGSYTPLPTIENVFLANSKETILQFWCPNGFTGDAAQLIPASASAVPTFAITENLINAFEATDSRKAIWIGKNMVSPGGTPTTYYYPAKYKNRVAGAANPEYVMALRLSEQYLIRAEALAQQNKIEEALADLNVIRIRAGLLPLAGSISKQACLEAISKERRLELFGEWGHRLLDLKRLGQLDATMSTLKPTWRLETAKAFPIPITDITYNSNLTQNHGY